MTVKKFGTITSMILVLIIVLLTQIVPAFADQANYDDVVGMFWSPVTPYHTLSYCPSQEAGQMRDQIKQMISEGKTKQEIVNYYVGLYGMRILQIPPKKGFFLSAWVMPFIGLIIGIGMIFLFVRKRKSKVVTDQGLEILASDIPDAEIDEEMKKYL